MIGRPQRHPPDRIGGDAAVARRDRRRALVGGVDGHDLRAERDAGGAGQRRQVEEQVRRLLAGERQRVGQHQPALGVGIADLDRQPLAAPQHVAGPEGGAGDGVLDRRDQDAEPDRQAGAMIMWARPRTLAAPPMSFFISSMPADGLMSRPPVSKQTPLPTSVTFGAPGSPQVKSISRGARAGAAAAPTAWISGKSSAQRVAHDHREARAVALGEVLRRLGEFGRARGRWRRC